MKKTLHIIPHSHWDREWYLPFEKHRFHLVELIDAIIEEMEANEEYRHFHLDGQYIAIEDYLAIRPERRERLWALIRAGKIGIGPWYVLQDEYLTSGESNVRNMLYGMRLCREGGVEPVMTGYFPDAFGNVSQAPQILQGFGIQSAVFGRGVNDVLANNQMVKENGITKSELIWRAPDGSEVVGVLMANWYHNAMELPAEEKALKERILLIAEKTERVAGTPHLLGMNGCDHQPLQKDLTQVLRLANRVQDKVQVVHSDFTGYIKSILPYKSEFPVFEGEINGQLSAGKNPLICTASAHIDIKQDNHDAEHLLSGVAEPLSALSALHGGKDQGAFFLYAWKTLMQNHPHDSICTCSCDEVYNEMKSRFAKVIACGEQLREEALAELSAQVNTSAVAGDAAITVFSLSPVPTVSTVQVFVDFDPAEGVEAIAVFDEAGREIPACIRLIRNQFTFTLPKDRFRQFKHVDRFVVEMQVKTEGIGYHTYAVKKCSPGTECGLVYGEREMENAFLRVSFRENGTMDVTDKRTGRTFAGMHLLEDTRDHGNLYNYVQAEGDIPVTSENVKASITCAKVTPYSVTFRVGLPLGIQTEVETEVTLSADVPRVDFRTRLVNQGENHRLRALFPSELATETVCAEGQFDVVRRNITPAETWKNPCNAQRMQAFVTLEGKSGEGLLLATRGLCEYEVLRDGKNTLALTLLRSVGYIGDWGAFHTPAGQKKGEYTLEYSLVPYSTSARAEAYGEGYAFAYPACVAVGGALQCGTLPPSADYLRFNHPTLRMTAFKRAENGEGLVLRFFNASEEKAELCLPLSSAFKGARRLNLAEDVEEELPIREGALSMEVPPKKIITLGLLH